MLEDRRRFELIVVGGGINGAAIAREAQLAGIETLLVEKDDFGAGTTATSTRLIHGGLRYLEHAEISLVRESLLERERLLVTASHLVKPLRIYLPLTRASRRGPLTIRAGMWLYDLLSFGKSLPRHRMLDRAALLDELPGLGATGLVGGAAYYDAQVAFPERLVIENLLDAELAGATLASQTTVRELIVENGRVGGVEYESAGRRGNALAPVVVNAAGPWVDAVLGRYGRDRLIGGTKGSHLIVRPFGGAPAHGVYAEAAGDGRPFFVLPWNGLYLIGTTDVRYDGDPGDAMISDAEQAYLLDETRRLFPGADDLEQQIAYSCAGVRPLPATEGVREGAITRRHLIEPHPEIDGLLSIVGGKLTTHRSLAVDCLTALRKRFPTYRRSPTQDRPLPGALDAEARAELGNELGSAFGPRTAERLLGTYGAGARGLVADAAKRSELGEPIAPGSDGLVGELVRAIDVEHAISLIDILQRRTMLGLGADFGTGVAPAAAAWLARLGIWTDAQCAVELDAYAHYAARHGVDVTTGRSARS